MATEHKIQENQLGYYYIVNENELKSEVTEDEENILEKKWRPPDLRKINSKFPAGAEHPVAVAQNGIDNYNRYLATKDKRFLKHSVQAANWLLEKQKSNGAWVYNFEWKDLPKNWYSGLAQGQAISLLCRIYQETVDRKYLESAELAYNFMLKPVNEGGCLAYFQDGLPIIEEYPNSEHTKVLNGAIFAIFGVRDLAITTGNKETYQKFLELANSIAKHLDDYDYNGYYSYYSLYGKSIGKKASMKYHQVHLAQLDALYQITGDERFKKTLDKWSGYKILILFDELKEKTEETKEILF